VSDRQTNARVWIAVLWERVRASLWFLPALIAGGALTLAALCARLDRLPALAETPRRWLFGGDADSATTLLSTVAGSMITVAGVSFSVTVVALSMASSQFGPRLLGNFMRDRVNQSVLGIFIGTFLFCLVALGSTAALDGSGASLSVSVGLLLAAVSLVMFIYFIHHIAASMQADQIIEAVARDLEQAVARVFVRKDPAQPWTFDQFPAAPQYLSSPVTGYVQVVDEAELLDIAQRSDLRLRVRHRAGQFVYAGAPLLEVDGIDELDESLAARLCGAFVIGGQRTAEQDPEFGVHQLVEVALRALSPGINDPFTAITCVDRLGGILAAVADCAERPPLRLDDHGQPRLQLEPIEFGGLLDAALQQIRQCATQTPSVAIRLLEALAGIAACTRRRERLAALAQHGEMVSSSCRHSMIEADRAVFDERMRRLQRQLADDAARS